jgi:hypothetical protein
MTTMQTKFFKKGRCYYLKLTSFYPYKQPKEVRNISLSALLTAEETKAQRG